MKVNPVVGRGAHSEEDEIIVPADLAEFSKAAYGLSTMAAAINWDGSRNTKEYLASLREKIETVQAMVRGLEQMETKAPDTPATKWKEIVSAPRNKRVIVISRRFPEPHEAMLYDNGWHTWGVSGSYKDDPYLWTELPSAPDSQQAVGAKTQPVIVVWDRNGQFFQNWTAEFKNGDGIDHGRRIAASMGGTYTIVGDAFVEDEEEPSPASL
jgi:hypothetical protein